MRQMVLQIRIERRIGLRRRIGLLDLQDQRHQRLGDKPPAELAEPAPLVRAIAQTVDAGCNVQSDLLAGALLERFRARWKHPDARFAGIFNPNQAENRRDEAFRLRQQPASGLVLRPAPSPPDWSGRVASGTGSRFSSPCGPRKGFPRLPSGSAAAPSHPWPAPSGEQRTRIVQQRRVLDVAFRAHRYARYVASSGANQASHLSRPFRRPSGASPEPAIDRRDCRRKLTPEHLDAQLVDELESCTTPAIKVCRTACDCAANHALSHGDPRPPSSDATAHAMRSDRDDTASPKFAHASVTRRRFIAHTDACSPTARGGRQMIHVIETPCFV